MATVPVATSLDSWTVHRLPVASGVMVKLLLARVMVVLPWVLILKIRARPVTSMESLAL